MKIPVTLNVNSCGAETLSLTSQGNQNLFFSTSLETTTSARLQASSSCGGVYTDFHLQSTTASDAHECFKKCTNTNLCTEFFFKKDGSGDCHLYKAGCTYVDSPDWDWYKVVNQAPTSVGSFYDNLFTVTTSNQACGIAKYYLGGCDAAGYLGTKYTDSSFKWMYMSEQS